MIIFQRHHEQQHFAKYVPHFTELVQFFVTIFYSITKSSLRICRPRWQETLKFWIVIVPLKKRRKAEGAGKTINKVAITYSAAGLS